jgi:hypothetical protein
LEYLGKGEKIFLRDFYLRAGLVDKGVWSSIGSRWKVFTFREKVVGQRLWGSGMIELMGEATAQAAGFGEDFFTGGLAKSEDEFLVLQRREKGHIVLVIDDNDGKGGA